METIIAVVAQTLAGYLAGTLIPRIAYNKQVDTKLSAGWEQILLSLVMTGCVIVGWQDFASSYPYLNGGIGMIVLTTSVFLPQVVMQGQLLTLMNSLLCKIGVPLSEMSGYVGAPSR